MSATRSRTTTKGGRDGTTKTETAADGWCGSAATVVTYVTRRMQLILAPLLAEQQTTNHKHLNAQSQKT